MVVEFGNTYYFIGLGVFFLLTLIVGLILKGKDSKKQKIILCVISFLMFATHFVKLAIPPYVDQLPNSIRKVTFENICAVSALTFPFIFLSKNKYLKDYMFYMGIISGLAAMIYPTEALGRDLLNPDVIRFYLVHMLIFIVPFYMVMCNLHELSLKRIFAFPLMFMLVLVIITANEIILIESGFVGMRNSDFLNPNYRNSSFVYGPTSEFREIVDTFIDWMVPKPFKTVMVGEYKGSNKYTPILWLLVPSYVYFSLFYIIIYFVTTKIFKRGKSYDNF